MSIGTGWLMISLKNFSPSSILLSHNIRSSGRLGFHQNTGAVGYRRTHACFAVLVFVHQLDMSVEEPPHLVTEAGLNAAASAAVL